MLHHKVQWVPKVSVRLRGAVRKTRFSKRSHKLNSRWNAIKIFFKVKIRVGFHLIFLGNFSTTRYVVFIALRKCPYGREA